MPSQTSPKAQVVVAALILIVSISLYLWPNEQSENTILKETSQATIEKKLPLSEWQETKETKTKEYESTKEIESYNPTQEKIESLKQTIVEPLNNLLDIKENNTQQNQGELLNSLSEFEEQSPLSVLTDIFGSSGYSVTPDCYREGPRGPVGSNVIAPCCNCGFRRRIHHGCSRYVSDQSNGGKGCLDPSKCCINLGCLNLYCPGKPAIWDPATGECGC